MPKYKLEVWDLYLRHWSLFCEVEAEDENKAADIGWEKVRELDFESRILIKDVRGILITKEGESEQ
ncbi:MAG: hypothetical protein P1Q69_17855 [Candidatus Thorarchaeota archaeon]|nr:hypothetical protein [Candidatus Thorarchaeota archaeon]